MKVTNKELFAKGFWAGFDGDPCVLDGAYREGYLFGSQLSGTVSRKQLKKMLTEMF